MDCEKAKREVREQIAINLLPILNSEEISKVTGVPLERILQFHQEFEKASKPEQEDWKRWMAEADKNSQFVWAREKGAEQGRRKVVENLLKHGHSLNEISDMLNIAIEELEKWVKRD